MKIIKLDAIDSTNNYLKGLTKTNDLENFTIVVAEFQTSGKGQYKNNWHSEKGKNLLFSMLIKFKSFKIENQTYLNFAISLAVYHVLNQYLGNVKIKWPNDIMSHYHKICGILIENTVKNDKISHSIIGIGLNVNQIDFPVEIRKATSLKKELQHSFNCDELMQKIIDSIKIEITKLDNNQFVILHDLYINYLFMLNKSATYITKNGDQFLGKIIGVSNFGKLQVELENKTINEFAVKEIKLANI